MTPDQRYRRMQELFEAAVELKPAERERFLAGACDADLRADVQSLLAHEAPAAAALESTAPRQRARSLDEADPEQVGPYQVLGVLGEGGFGVVYRAERRHPMVQQVALKIIKPGMDSRGVLRRFDQERQALAVMDHPNVARVFDAGVTTPEQGSRPYFVMELVQGEPITLYCDRHRLTVRQRLALFISVCEAVQHAHMKGIIHRDLKPSNILVTAGGASDGAPTPKVIDFGVAKAVAHTVTTQTVFTEQGQVIGTPEYMSPEQAEMGALDIDTRTDVYSLGVVLYELLTGALPFAGHQLWSKGFAEVQRIIREVDPPRPSTRLTSLATPAERATGAAIAEARHTRLEELSRELRRELEWIPLKAMRKSRSERYRSAIDLADDIRNYLAGKALNAGPESTTYRIRKFIRRRRGTVIAGAAVVVSLLTGTVVSAVFAIGQARARVAEEQQFSRAEAINSFLSRMLTAADPSMAKGEKVTVREALDAAAKRIDDGELRDQPLVDAELRVTIGETYYNLGLYPSAAAQLRAAEAIQARALGTDHIATLQTRTLLAESLYMLTDFPGAIAAAEPTLAELRRTLGPDRQETLRVMIALGVVLGEVGRFAEGEALLLEAIESHRRTSGPDDPATADALNQLGEQYVLHALEHKSEPLHRAAWRIHAKALGDDDIRTLRSVHRVASALMNLRREREAEPLFRSTYETRLRLLGPEHFETICSMFGMGMAAARLGRNAEAEPILRHCAEYMVRVHGRSNAYTIEHQRCLASVLWGLGKKDEAERLLRDALQASVEAFGPEHYDTTLRAMCALAHFLALQEKDAEAEDLARQALGVQRRMSPPPSALEFGQSAGALLKVLRRQGRKEEARQIGAELVDFLAASAIREGASAAGLNNVAWELLTSKEPELRDPTKALELALKAVERSGHTDPNSLDTLALAYHQTGDSARAVETQLKALKLLPLDAPTRAEFEGRLRDFQAAMRDEGSAPGSGRP